MKKVNKIYMAIMLALVIIISGVQKVVALTSDAGKFDTLYVGVPEHDAVYNRPALYYYTLDGAMAYCLEMAVSVQRTEYDPVEYNDPRIGYALVADHGYTWNDAANFQIRQAVIWALLGQINIENLYEGDPGCVQAAKDLYYAAASYTGVMGAPQVSDTNISFTLQDMQYVSNTITVNMAENSKSFDIDLFGLPEGSYVSDVNGNPVGTVGYTSGTTFQVRIPVEVITYDITSIDLAANGYGEVYNTTNAYNSVGVRSQQLLSSDYEVIPSSTTSRFYLVSPISAVGNLEVTKNDEYGKPIEGVTFRVSNGTTTVTGVTGADGIVRFNDLPAGAYTVTETNAADGYVNDNADISAQVITGITTSVTKTNNQTKARVKIIKLDSVTGSIPQGDAKLEGAVYKIYAKEDIYTPNKSTLIYQNGQEVATCTTGADGVTNTVELPLGKYMYKEVTASQGYLLNDTEVDFSIEYDNQNKV